LSSFSMHGIGVSSGIAIGRAHLVSNALLEVVHYQLPTKMVDSEIQRFDDAIATVKKDLEAVRAQLPANAPAELASFINTHLVMLCDRSLSEAPKDIIRKEHCNAEWAIKLQMDDIVEQFDAIADEYLRERKHDVIQVVERVIKVLLGHPNPSSAQNTSQSSQNQQEHAIILVAHDISPADAIQFKHHHFAAFITDVGGVTSHTAILARSLNIPSIVALQRARDLIDDGEWIIVDGSQGWSSLIRVRKSWPNTAYAKINGNSNNKNSSALPPLNRSHWMARSSVCMPISKCRKMSLQ
jgi:phosphoenolpyruvate-protein phosphotransferase (PTS system enzyme I)